MLLPPCSPVPHPSLRPGLFAGGGYFPAAASGEGGDAALPALREENGQTSAGGRWRESGAETGLPARLQHAQMYDIRQNGLVFRNQIAPGEDWRMATRRNNFDVSRAADLRTVLQEGLISVMNGGGAAVCVNPNIQLWIAA